MGLKNLFFCFIILNFFSISKALTQSVLNNKITLEEAKEYIVNDSSTSHYGKFYFSDKIDKEAETVLPSLSLTESLGQKAGVWVQKTSSGQSSPYVRGFSGFRNLTLFDGIRINHSVWREGPNQYLGLVNSVFYNEIDLIPSSSSIRYGSDAVGGTLLIKSYSLVPNEITNNSWLTQWYSAEQSQLVQFNHRSHMNEKFSYNLGIGLQNKGDVRIGKESESSPYTGYSEYGLGLKASYFFDNPSTQLDFGFYKQTQLDVPRTHRTIYSKSYFGTQVGSEYKHEHDHSWDLTYIKFKSLKNKNFFSSIESTLYSQSWAEDQYRLRSNGKFDAQGTQNFIAGFKTELEKDEVKGPWRVGFELVDEKVSSYKNNYFSNGLLEKVEVQGPVGDDSSYLIAGLFIERDLNLSNNWQFLLGARNQSYKVQVGRYLNPQTQMEDSFERQGSVQAFSGRAIYMINNSFNLFGGFSESFRLPNLSDYSRLDEARSNEIETASPDLFPELFKTLEVGTNWGSLGQRVSTSIFYTKFSNHILLQPTGNTITGLVEVTKANAGIGHVQGLEIIYENKMERSFLSLEGALVDGIIENGEVPNQPMTRMMPLRLKGSFDYQLANKIQISIASEYLGTANKLSERDKRDVQRIPPGGSPSYQIWNLGLRGQLNPLLSWRFFLNNVFDTQYRVHGSGYTESGQNLIMTLSGSF